MNTYVLQQLRRTLRCFQLPEATVHSYLHQLLLKHFFPHKSYAKNVPAGITTAIQKILKKHPPYPDGTPQQLTPEIIALLRENTSLQRKEKGIFYTPWKLGVLLAQETLDSWERTHSSVTATQLRRLKIIDPAAGAGGLLLPFALELTSRICAKTQQSFKKTLSLVLQQQLYAIDLSSKALEDYALRAQILVGRKHKLSLHTKATDALATRAQKSILQTSFPDIFKNGGFDIVLSNPPYIGQKNHASLFRSLRNDPLWSRYINPHSDFIYLFLHLAMLLLRPGGMAGFITTPYFTTAAGARLLRQRFYKEASFLRLLNFGEKNLFPGTNQHTLLSVFVKEKVSIPCLIGTGKTPLQQAQVYEGPLHFIHTQTPNQKDYPLQHILKKLLQCPLILADVAHVSSGLMTGCDRISSSHLQKYTLDNVKKGEGVFILSDNELKTLTLTKRERKKIKPFFKNSDISAYVPNTKNKYWLIDLFYPNDRNLDISHYPNLLAHLTRFKPVLLARKQNNNGIQHQLAAGKYWFGSVRRKMNFEGEKLIVPHRAKKPCFAYSNGAWYASSDVYFISSPKGTYSLWALVALLNSPVYHLWLYYNGKRKGNLLELYAEPLKNIPLPSLSAKQQHQLCQLAHQLTQKTDTHHVKESLVLQKKIAHFTAQLLGLTSVEEKALNHWSKKH